MPTTAEILRSLPVGSTISIPTDPTYTVVSNTDGRLTLQFTLSSLASYCDFAAVVDADKGIIQLPPASTDPAEPPQVVNDLLSPHIMEIERIREAQGRNRRPAPTGVANEMLISHHRELEIMHDDSPPASLPPVSPPQAAYASAPTDEQTSAEVQDCVREWMGLPKPSPTPESPQMPSKATDTEPATQALPDPFGPQEALLEAIQSGAVAHWASGGAIVRRRRGMEQAFAPFHDKPDFLSTAFEWQMAPTVEYPATPEALLQLMLSVLKEADDGDSKDQMYATDRGFVREGLDRLAAKLGLKGWKRLSDKYCE